MVTLKEKFDLGLTFSISTEFDTDSGLGSSILSFDQGSFRSSISSGGRRQSTKYTADEIARCGDFDTKSDIYSLAIIGLELLDILSFEKL